MDLGEIAALVAAGAFLLLVLLLARLIWRLGGTVDAATRAINNLNENAAPMLSNMNVTIENVNTTLGQVQTSLDGLNIQLAKVDAITGHAQTVTANIANLATVISAAAANPLVKVAAFGYGVRRAAAARRHAEEEREVRAALKEQRRTARRRGGR